MGLGDMPGQGEHHGTGQLSGRAGVGFCKGRWSTRGWPPTRGVHDEDLVASSRRDVDVIHSVN